MPTQKPPKRLVIRWTTVKGLATIILFLTLAILTEYIVVLYATSISKIEKDETLLQWNFQFPGTNWPFAIAVSPLFHLVPMAVIITLVFCWTYLTRYAAVEPYEARREKVGTPAKRGKETRLKKIFGKIGSGLLRVRGFSYLWQKIHFTRATIKSALIVLPVFLVFILLISLLAHPKLIYQTVTSFYRSNPSLSNLVKGISQSLAPIGGILSAVNNALLSAAPGFKGFVLSLGAVFRPLVDLDNVGKYLVFQNLAAWISALTALFYGEYTRKDRRFKRKFRG